MANQRNCRNDEEKKAEIYFSNKHFLRMRQKNKHKNQSSQRFILFDYYYRRVFFRFLFCGCWCSQYWVLLRVAFHVFLLCNVFKLFGVNVYCLAICVQLLNGAIPVSIIWLDILMCLSAVFFLSSFCRWCCFCSQIHCWVSLCEAELRSVFPSLDIYLYEHEYRIIGARFLMWNTNVKEIFLLVDWCRWIVSLIYWSNGTCSMMYFFFCLSFSVRHFRMAFESWHSS